MTLNLSREGPSLRLSGYASLFDTADLSGDIVCRGAFSASLLSQIPSPVSRSDTSMRIPMLFGHDTSEAIGVWDRVFEDATGLFVSGRLLLGSPLADRTARLVKTGAVSGLSIGYRVRRYRPLAREVLGRGAQAGRKLLEIDLWEVSVVTFPMLREARITQIGDPESESFMSDINPDVNPSRRRTM